MNNRKLDLLEVLSFNLHAIWAISKLGKDFFMASYVVNVCYSYLEFNHPIFLTWPHPSNDPIHMLFKALYVHRYHNYIIPICTHFYPSIYKSITKDDMPRIFEAVRKDLKLISAWWYFQESTIIKVKGTLIPPTTLPLYVPS